MRCLSGIGVNVVAPGPVRRPLNPPEKQAEDVSQFGADSTIKQPARLDEIAPASVVLVSPISAPRALTKGRIL